VCILKLFVTCMHMLKVKPFRNVEPLLGSREGLRLLSSLLLTTWFYSHQIFTGFYKKNYHQISLLDSSIVAKKVKESLTLTFICI